MSGIESSPISPSQLVFLGITTGVTSSFLLNPLDRAFFRMIRDSKSISDPSIWSHPWQGVIQTIYSRTISYGVPFSLFDIYQEKLKKITPHSTFYSSLATAATTATLCQPINLSKMYLWSLSTPTPPPTRFIPLMKLLIEKYGWRVLLKCLTVVCFRDGVFAATYFILSKEHNKKKNPAVNLLIASIATAASSPWNYYRNRHFFDFDEKNVTPRQVFKELCEETSTKKGLISKIHHVFHARLNIGLGTLRIGLGMALANFIHDRLKQSTVMPEWF